MKQRRAMARVVAATVFQTTLAALRAHRRQFRYEIARTWRDMEATQPATGQFSPSLAATYPEPVQRYLTHAIQSQARLPTTATLTIQGDIKLGPRWTAFTARQILRPFQGFVWSARVRQGPLWIEGADLYSQYRHGYAHMRFDLFGLIPLVNSSTQDVRRSAAGRMFGESIWMPSALPGEVVWEVVDDTHINATRTVDGHEMTLRLTIGETGRLRSLVMDRWNTDQQCLCPFGMEALEEGTFGRFTIPVRGHAGWWFGTDRYAREGKFYAYTITQARYD